jgi:Holliday junction DNA helicase RuvA
VIGSLRGVVLERVRSPSAGEVLLEVGGVGYRLAVPVGTLALADPGGPLFVHVHTHVREDAIVLYGFATADERRCFEALIGVHGIGPALALALLSTHAPAALRRVVLTDDAAALTAVPGVGAKTATRLLLELKAKLDLDLDLVGDDGLRAVPDGATPASARAEARAEVRAALSGLGYGADEVRDAVRELPEDGAVEDLLRQALRVLAGAR